MFTLLTQIMLVALIGYLAWSALVKGSGKDTRPREYLAWFGLILIIFFLILSFITPYNPAVIAFGSILTFPLKPLGLAILLLFFALLQEVKKKGNSITNKGINYVWSAFLILVIFSLPLVASLLAQRSTQATLTAYNASFQRRQTVDAIVLLGHSSPQLSLLNPNQLQLTDRSDRILQVVQEYKRQRALGCRPLVIVSAGPKPGLYNDMGKPLPAEGYKIRDTLVAMGIPREDIRVEPKGADIRSSAVEVKRIVNQEDVGDRIIVVTSILTGQRVRQAFAREGLKATPSPAGYYTVQAVTSPQLRVNTGQSKNCDTLQISLRNARQLRISDFIPNAESLLISTRVINEFWSSVYYFLRGWLGSSIEPVSLGSGGGC